MLEKTLLDKLAGVSSPPSPLKEGVSFNRLKTAAGMAVLLLT